jgi:hypothetical protein
MQSSGKSFPGHSVSSPRTIFPASFLSALPPLHRGAPTLPSGWRTTDAYAVRSDTLCGLDASSQPPVNACIFSPSSSLFFLSIKKSIRDSRTRPHAHLANFTQFYDQCARKFRTFLATLTLAIVMCFTIPPTTAQG